MRERLRLRGPQSIRQIEQRTPHDSTLRRALAALTGGRDAQAFLSAAARDVRAGKAAPDTLRCLIGLLLLNVEQEERRYAGTN